MLEKSLAKDATTLFLRPLHFFTFLVKTGFWLRTINLDRSSITHHYFCAANASLGL